MPLYEYKCLKCGRRTERIEGVSGPYLKKCPHCGGKLESVITAPAIQEKPVAEAKETTSKEKDAAAKETASKEKDTASKESKEKKPAKKK